MEDNNYEKLHKIKRKAELRKDADHLAFFIFLVLAFCSYKFGPSSDNLVNLSLYLVLSFFVSHALVKIITLNES